ncbi:MAG: hypothetical protein LBB72_03565 [Spirochaetaceae bacterium]|nr:hypothetical protein [Spirochaetaceae bacterium]
MMSKNMFFLVLLCAGGIILYGCKHRAPVETANVIDPQSDFNRNSENFGIAMNGANITINWAAVPQAALYEISRGGSRLGAYTALGATEKTSYTDTAPNKNKYENYYKITAKNGNEIISEQLASFELKMFGGNIMFYDQKYDKIDSIEKEINRIHDTEMLGSIQEEGGRRAEFSSKRYAMYFKPGEYKGFTEFKIGFYTHIAGLGKVPVQTRLFGSVVTPPHLPNNNATCTFWRSIENFQINGGAFDWGVSQAAPVRRMKLYVPARFDWKNGWASGGFSGDCYFTAEVGSWSQQQWYARNSHFVKAFQGVNWNKVIQGSTGQIEDDNWESGGCITKEDTTPVIREKPFLYMDNGEYKVFVPALRREAKGVSWTDADMGPGHSLDLVNDFYIARAGADTANTINAALSGGKHIFFTPGRYELSAPLRVAKAGTVMLGTGYATLIPGPQNRYGALFIDDVDNVTVAGLMFDALYNSAYLVCVGAAGAKNSHSAAPALLADIFLRVGGYKPESVNAGAALIVNSNDVIGDHLWIWRADHGQGVGWNLNTSKNGLIVTGGNVTFYGLLVEHFQEYQTLWLGDNGRTYFYQNESPYDPTNHSVYRSHNGTVDGWAAYKVANSVNSHYAVGLGVYAVFNRTGPDRNKSESVFLQNAIEVPNKPRVVIKNACILNLSGGGGVPTGIRSIVNGTGTGAMAGVKREYIMSYRNGAASANSGNLTGISPSNETFTIPVNLLP